MACKFIEMIDKRWDAGWRVCVGLDSEWEKLPERYRRGDPIAAQYDFNVDIINATKHLVLCYKPNLAFYCGTKDGRYYAQMQEVLKASVAYIRRVAPDVPVVLDTKDADIGNSNIGYVNKAFKHFATDAVTVHNYLGMEAMAPFLEQKDKGIIVLCKTSNKGGGEFQDLVVEYDGRRMPMYQVVAHRVQNFWNYNGNCGLVVGATYPTQLKPVRDLAPDLPILIPGIGTQGGDLEGSVQNGIDKNKRGIFISTSSGVIFAKDPEREVLGLTASIERIINPITE